MASSGSVPGKGRIRASVKKLSLRVPENGCISVNTEKWYLPIHYRKKVESVRVSKNCLGEYKKRVESVGVTKNGIIRVTTGKR